MSPHTCPAAQGAASVTGGGSARIRPASEAEVASLPRPPGPKGPGFRNLYRRVWTCLDLFERMHRDYGDVVFLPIVYERLCMLFDPELVLELLEREGELFEQNMAGVKIPRLRHDTLQMTRGAQHRWRHEIIAPAFHEGMDEFSAIMVERSRELVNGWRAGDVINVDQEFLRLAAGVMGDAIFGPGKIETDVLLHWRRAVKWEAISLVVPFGGVVGKLPVPAMRNARAMLDQFDGLVLATVRDARAGRSSVSGSLITRMVRGRSESEAGRQFADSEILAEVYWLFAAALGPSAHTAAWAIEFLARNPAARRRLEREASAVDLLPDKGMALLSGDHLSYAKAVYAEAVRLSPIAYVGIDKRAVVDLVVDGFLVPRGTLLYGTSGFVHRNENCFERAIEFLPERWLEDAPATAPHAYMPFGHGYRTCAGREFATRLAVCLLTSMAQRFRLEPVSSRPAQPEFPVYGPYRIKGGLQARVASRS